MQKKRFFVTYVLILITALGVAALSRPQERPHGSLVYEANAKLSEIREMNSRLNAAAKWDLNLRSLDERRALAADVAHYLVDVNRVLEISARPHNFLENREEVLRGRDRAELVQKSVEEFENSHGATYDPKRISMNSDAKKVL